MRRLEDLRAFYSLLALLESQHGGKRLLSSCSGRLPWPQRGVYFFFEPGEDRTDSGTGARVVRVGTHAVSRTSSTTLWTRLSQHRGTSTGGGNHRGSIFRLLAGEAIMASNPSMLAPTWATRHREPVAESVVERAVSAYLGAMSLLWLEVPDPPSPRSLRARIERNAIALLSNVMTPFAPLDLASPAWLGRHSPRPLVKLSGLWNQDHVDHPYDALFLKDLESLIAQPPPPQPTVPPSTLLALLRTRTAPGDTIRTLSQNRPNTIAKVTDEALHVVTSRSTKPEPVPWSWVESALDQLCATGTLTADTMPARSRYRSTFILSLIAAKLPEYVTVERGPPTRLGFCLPD